MNMNMNMMEATDREDTFRQHTVSAVGQSIAQKRKSLFNSQRQREQSLIACAQTAAHQMKDTKLPHFKPHLFGSPFYPGQTMYGGSSSLSTYMNEPYTKQRKLADRIESRDADTVNISTSSRRVMDLLENYSSPLIEAKRITRYELSELRDITKNIQPNTSTRHSYKTQELYIPSTAALIRMKARNRLMDSTKAARQIIASHSSTLSTYQPYARDKLKADQPDISAPAKAQTKLKSRLTRLNRGEDSLLNSDRCANCDKMQINMKPINSLVVTKKTNTWKCGDCWVDNEEKAEKCACCGSRNPKQGISQKPINSLVVTENANKWKCGGCWVDNEEKAEKCVCCGSRNPKQGISQKPINSLVVTENANKWKCGGCWVDNEEKAEKCVCCGSRNPSQDVPTAPLSIKQTVAPVSTEKDWRCEDCMIANKPAIEKCAACGGAKPGTKAATKTLSTASSQFKEANNAKTHIMEAQMSYWECTVCLASNANDKLTCMCCDANRYPQNNSQAKFTNFKFNADSNSGFKFGIDPKIQEINLSKNMDTSQPENTEKFETNNNIVPKVPSYTFTLPAKKPSDNVDSPKIVDTFTLLAKKPSDNITVDSLKSVENPKPSFSFGIPKQTPTPISTGFGLNMAPATKPLDIEKPAEDIERPQEVPSINFTAPEATKPSTGLFSQPPPSKNPQNAMNAFLNVSAEAKKVASSKSPVQPSAVLETPQLQFNFSDSAVKPSTGGLFTSPASTASSNSLTMQSLPASTLVTGMFSKPETTATSVMSFFTKPGTTPTPSTTSEATVRPAMSFFSKPETTSAPSTSLFSNKTQSSPAEPAASTAPNASFSFFPTTSSAPANASKGFKFNFASTTTAPAFGAAPQTITSTFSLPAANLLTNGSTNPLGGNSIPVNNLATTITGNEMDGTNAVASTGNAMLGSDSVSMFSAPAKENASMWPNTTAQTNQPNPFMASAPSKAPFSFGATPAPFPFGATEINAQPIVFGASPQPTQNIFGINQNNASQPMFASSAAPANQPAPMFGSAQPVNSAQPMGMFGAPSSTAFGTSSDSMNTIDESSLPTAPTPAFNFSAAAQSSTVFGFGQQAQQPQMQPAGMQQAGMQQAGMQQAGMQQAGMQQAGMQQAGMQQAGMQALQQPAMYNFGAAPGPGQLQFNIGTNSARRMHNALRKCNQR